jgi:2-polyprenyl-6-methoxyphenol hydroxylase-like FAD-dependent oxidoreductase
LAGLMCAIALKHSGHNVIIIEKDKNERQSHMAGVCLGLDAELYLKSHDRNPNVFSHRCLRIQAIKKDESIQIFVNARRDITNWDTLYFRLRSLFDAFPSSFYPSPPQTSETDGSSTYDCQKQVLDIKSAPDRNQMVLKILDLKTQVTSETDADLVIGADGPDSFVRSKYLPHVRRQYSGYVAWRGTVPEREVSTATRDIFKRSVTVSMMHRHHVVVYMIPGIDGSLEPGERFLNFLWYTNESVEALDEIMKDGIDGHRHHNIVPSGHVREDLWAARVETAREIGLVGPFMEVITKIRQPFIQVITDFCAPQAAFEQGKVLLMGDALCLFRPHTAFSGTQAAFHASRIEELVNGKISLQEWESTVVQYSRLHWLQSIWYGNFYQYHMARALVSAVHYWWYCGVDMVQSWCTGKASLLRTISYVVEEYDSE